jgi:hypothetical protein
MMRLLRTPVIVLSLLTSTATASAECAWVLWEHTWKDRSWWRWRTQEQWVPNGAVTGRNECEKGQTGLEKRWYSIRETARKVNPTAVDTSEHAQWICLPDTLDPRGPKGKPVGRRRPRLVRATPDDSGRALRFGAALAPRPYLV